MKNYELREMLIEEMLIEGSDEIYVQGVGKYSYKSLARNVEKKITDLLSRAKKGDFSSIGKSQLNVLSEMWLALSKSNIKEELLFEGKMTAPKIVKMFKNKAEWGDLGKTTRVKKGNIEVIDTFFYGGDKALKDLIKDWTDSKHGTIARYFMDEYNVMFKLVDSFQVIRAKDAGTTWYKKLTDDGVVSITLKVIQY